MEFISKSLSLLRLIEFESVSAGEEIDFSIMVKALATGHNFPTGSVEERDVWLHVSLNNELSEPIERDGLTEGDRIYHSVFLDSKGEFTYAQWFCVEEIENRLRPFEERMEAYTVSIPGDLPDGQYTVTAVLNYRRIPDPHADFLKVQRRPVIEVSRDARELTVLR